MEENQKPHLEEFEYKAEMKQLLNIIVHSLYTHPEVFLRELISNASDALNKVRFRRLTDSNISDPELDLQIKITLDKENQLFSIEDTGIGMTKDELINQIGTVASSGTLSFLKKLQEEKKPIDGNLIGQFGVGFYSVFMVTDEIGINTKSVNPNSTPYIWKSVGQDKFSIEESEKEHRGTVIFFKLKDEFKEYSEPWKVKEIIQKYSNFVDFPIFVDNEEVNKVTALWHRKKEDVKEEEYNEFYKFLTNDFQPPLGTLHLSIEGNLNFKSLLFIPEKAPTMLFRDTSEKNLHLYSNKIFIQDDCKDLLPDYLLFVKGVVDTEDLPLNISREVTQYSPIMEKIKNILTGKILSLLEEWADSDRNKYNKFFKEFSSLFKIGLNSDYTNKSRIVNLIRFESSLLEKGELTSFKEYISRMKEEQKEIYYVLGNHRDLIENNPNIEYFKKRNIEVLYMTDPVDVFTVPYIFDYEQKPLKSIDKADIELEETETGDISESLGKDVTNSLISLFKDVLGDKVEDVKESKRLVESAVTLVVGKQGLDPQMEKMMQLIDKEYTSSKRILEINTSHQLIKNLSKLYISDSNNPLLRKSIIQLYEGALLIEGYLKSPVDFVQRMNELMEEATKY